MMVGNININVAAIISKKVRDLSLSRIFILKGCKVIEITILALVVNGNKSSDFLVIQPILNNF
jgi:hypothetical protein